MRIKLARLSLAMPSTQTVLMLLRRSPPTAATAPPGKLESRTAGKLICINV
jgi:hypothetical protein